VEEDKNHHLNRRMHAKRKWNKNVMKAKLQMNIKSFAAKLKTR